MAKEVLDIEHTTIDGVLTCFMIEMIKHEIPEEVRENMINCITKRIKNKIISDIMPQVSINKKEDALICINKNVASAKKKLNWMLLTPKE